jgi:hypothetical protein
MLAAVGHRDLMLVVQLLLARMVLVEETQQTEVGVALVLLKQQAVQA